MRIELQFDKGLTTSMRTGALPSLRTTTSTPASTRQTSHIPRLQHRATLATLAPMLDAWATAGLSVSVLIRCGASDRHGGSHQSDGHDGDGACDNREPPCSAGPPLFHSVAPLISRLSVVAGRVASEPVFRAGSFCEVARAMLPAHLDWSCGCALWWSVHLENGDSARARNHG
jgi:hypothetical protein